MPRLNLTLACGPYDRTEALRSGEVQPSGIDLTYVTTVDPDRTAACLVDFQELDLAEMPAAYYLARRAQAMQGGEDFPFIAVPVFPARQFVHSSVFVNARSGIVGPAGLQGRKMGVHDPGATAAVWTRGILADYHDVDFGSVDLCYSGTATALAPPVGASSIPPGATLSEMLTSGEVEALISPSAPPSFRTEPSVRRLFPDHHAVDLQYYRETSMFPITHTVAVRRSLYDRHPWVAESMYDAFVRSRNHATDLLELAGATKTMLPWQWAAIEELRNLSDTPLWTYGLKRNRDVLETLVRYLVEQGFIERCVPVNELFIPVIETRT